MTTINFYPSRCIYLPSCEKKREEDYEKVRGSPKAQSKNARYSTFLVLKRNGKETTISKERFLPLPASSAPILQNKQT